MAVLAATSVSSAARPALVVRSVSGEGRVERGQGTPEPLRPGATVGSGDVVETSARSRVMLTFGNDGQVVLGADSRALFSVNGVGGRHARIAGIVGSLFGGALFVKTGAPCSLSVLTPTGVAQWHGGALAVVLDAATGESGFLALAGDSLDVRNVSQPNGRRLVAGQAAVVAPGADASAPGAVTETHVAVLANFFGDSCAQAWMSLAALRPRGDDAIGGQPVPGERALTTSAGTGKQTGPTTYRRLFRLNDIYGSILNDDAEHAQPYRRATQSGSLFANRWALALGGGAALAGGNAYPLFALSPSFRWRFIDAGLRLSVAKNHAGYGLPQFSGGLDGALDIIDHLTVGVPRDSLYATFGPLCDYTIGDGLVVNRFDNRNPYSLYRPLALHGQANIGRIVCADAFVADVSNFSMGGLRFFYHSLGYYAGLGYYYDANQYHSLPHGEGARFTDALPDTLPPGSDVQIAEVNLGLDIAQSEGILVSLTGGMAYRFRTLTTKNGYALRAPELTFEVPRVRFGLSYVQEAGRLTSGYFNWSYPTDRYRVSLASGSAVPASESSLLDRARIARGLLFFAGASPLPGLSLDAEYHQDFASHHVFADTAARGRNNYDFYGAVAMNDTLWRYIKYAKLALGDVGGGRYPPGGTLSTNWGLRLSFYLLTVPLVWNIAAECGFDYYNLDLDPAFNNRVDASTDHVFEFYAGLRWGFL